MSLITNAPNLDDRRFQELVDEAKRMVQRRCPDWTDHNVSDPGVTLIETFAYLVDQLLYRLNRVPDHQYLRYLELMGVERLPPAAATVPVTFWLSAPQEEDVVIERGVEVATRRHRDADAVVFATVERIDVVRTKLKHLLTFGGSDDAPNSRLDDVAREEAFPVFSPVPQEGDALLIGLDRPAPSCTIRVRITSDGRGDGVDRTNPPLRWEAMCDDGWVECEVQDGTGGLNDDADAMVHLPPDHAEIELFDEPAGWVRCIVVPRDEEQPAYTATPGLFSVDVATIGATVEAVHGQDVLGEILGVSDGTSNQRFALAHPPVVRSGEPMVVEVSSPEGWQEWLEVDGFAESGPSDRHWRLEAHDGIVVFGPAVRDEDGSVRQFGAVPAVSERIRIRSYRNGGGRHGNVARGAVVTPRSAIPFVAKVENRQPARGGLDAESADEARQRGPLVLGTRDRAVTLADYEHLATRASGQVARARAVEVGEDGRPAEPGEGVGVKVLVVPTVGSFEETGEFRFEQLVPSDELLQHVRRHLAERRLVGARVMVGPSRYAGVSVAADIQAKPSADPSKVALGALQALYRYLSPLTGGTESRGWPYGRPLNVGELYGVLQVVQGVSYVERVRMFPVNPLSGEREAATDRLNLAPDSLIFASGHRVRVMTDAGG